MDFLTASIGRQQLLRGFAYRTVSILYGCLLLGSAAQSGEIHEVAAQGDRVGLAKLLKENNLVVAEADLTGLTPLHHAVIHRQLAAVKILVAARADVNARDRQERTPLHYITHSVEESVLAKLKAADGGRFAEAVDLLANQGSAITPGALFNLLRENSKVQEGSLALLQLFAACSTPEQMHMEVVIARALLAAGADPRATDKTRSTPLHHAAMSPRPDLARALLDAGANVDVLTRGSMTPLHTAALFGGLDTADLLLKRGADVNGRASLLAVTPLFHAISRENPEIATLLVERGADVNALAPQGETPLCRAALFGGTEVARLLLSRGANPRVRFSATNQTPLHAAASCGETALIELLLACGVDADAVDKAGFTPLSAAAARGHIAILDLLLKAGAKPNTASALGRTPLWRAAAQGHAEAVELLLAYGGDSQLTPQDGQSPLHIAALNAHTTVVRALLTHGSNDDLGSTGTPLHSAAYGPGFHALHAASAAPGQKSPAIGSAADSALCANLLIEHGADIEKLDSEGRTPLLVAAQYGNLPVLEALLMQKANASCRDRLGLTALHLAAKGPVASGTSATLPELPVLAATGSGSVISLLVSKGAVVGTQDRDGRTPLHHAVASGNLPALLALMSARSSVLLADSSGATPLHWAAARGRSEAALALLNAGAACEAVDAQGQTPLHMAAAAGHRELVEILLAQGAKVTARNIKGQMPAHYAEAYKHPELSVLLRPAKTETAGR